MKKICTLLNEYVKEQNKKREAQARSKMIEQTKK